MSAREITSDSLRAEKNNRLARLLNSFSEDPVFIWPKTWQNIFVSISELDALSLENTLLFVIFAA